VGFLEYAWSVFLEKESLKTKLLVSQKTKSCRLYHNGQGFVAILPEPTVQETKEGEKTASLMGYSFPATNEGKKQLLRLFRAAVLHLGIHTLHFEPHDYEDWTDGKDRYLSDFVISTIEDTKVNAYAILRYRDKLADLAFANSLALKRMRNVNRLINPATKCMAGLLVKSNTGLDWVDAKEERDAIAHMDRLLDQFRKKASLSFAEENTSLRAEEIWLADEIYEKIVDVGPVTIIPYLPHTEELGKGSVFLTSYSVGSDIAREDNFRKCLEFLDGAPLTEDLQTDSKVAEAEATQVFDSWTHQKTKEEDIISKYRSLMTSTGFKSIEIPEQDYTEFLRIRARCKSEAHRLMETLLVARDALDEDPRKDYGVLDLQEIIQVIAGKSPRMDVFMLDENLSKSYSWVILIDASKSMEHLKDFAMEILLILCDAANELLLDPTSWGVYAFSDRFFIVKDPKERYNMRVKARIGGIRFEGSTLLSDALMTGGQVIKSRAENMRLITVISDGYSYEYSKASDAVLGAVRTLEGRSISLIGIGAKSRKMEALFKLGFSVYTLRDLSRKFSSLYLSASRVAAET